MGETTQNQSLADPLDPYSTAPSLFRAGAAALMLMRGKSPLPTVLTYMMNQGKDR